MTNAPTIILDYDPPGELPPLVPKALRIQLNIPGPHGPQKCTGFQVDTGSVGIVLPEALLKDCPKATKTNEPAIMLYSSNDGMHRGYIYEVDGLTLGKEGVPLDRVRVLAVYTEDPPHMLGVGIGNHPVAEQRQNPSLVELPEKFQPPPDMDENQVKTELANSYSLDNPFLKVTGVARAYTLKIVPKKAVYAVLGSLDEEQSFTLTKLMSAADYPYGYAPPDVLAEVTLNGQKGSCQAGLLMDTGLNYMFLKMGTKVEGNLPAHLKGATVHISTSNGMLDYEFTVPLSLTADFKTACKENTNIDSKVLTSPAWVSYSTGNTTPFVNTGIHLMAEYDYHVDVETGVMGFSKR